MEIALPSRIVLIGPSGSGKSVVASALADRLNYATVDTDALIVEQIGMPIAAFFVRFGEPAFRAIESQVVARCMERNGIVVATGGGAVLAAANWVAWRPRSVVLGLTATPETLVRRVRGHAAQAGNDAERPLLAGDPEARMRAMLAARADAYGQADITIDTEGLDVAEVSALAWQAIERVVGEGRVPELSIGTPVERSDIYIGDGIRLQVPELMRRRWPSARRAWIVTDEHVAAHWLAETIDALSHAGFRTGAIVVPPGEGSKSMSQVSEVCDSITTGGATRRDIVVALGGGVVGDLAGFAASICLRGLSLIQMPTSLLAMVDSSVGGKTGVNNPAGKNMIGAFYQPGIVAIDPAFLSTLAREEYRSGMAEVIKHAAIQPSTPFGGRSLAELLGAAKSLDPIQGISIENLLSQNVSIKQSVVQADEREAGLRMILNFGHTAGHAIEADGYRYRHGEAVALGMLVATEIAERLDRIDDGWGESLSSDLIRAGLPTRIVGSIDDIMPAMSRDKKAVDGAVNWVLPNSDGTMEIVREVPVEVVAESLAALGAR